MPYDLIYFENKDEDDERMEIIGTFVYELEAERIRNEKVAEFQLSAVEQENMIIRKVD